MKKVKTYGQKLRERMFMNGISLKKLAELTGYGISNLSRLRHDKYDRPAVNMKKTIETAITEYISEKKKQ